MTIPLIDIRPDHWQIVKDILNRHVPQHEVWAFGSRAKWTAKQYSDLDLAVITDRPLPLKVSAALADDFSESDLPWKVDVVDWAKTSESFRGIIERDKVVVRENVGTGSVQDNINLQTLDRLVLSVPELAEQRAIAHILGTLDDKIELNRRMNETLEAMARALFKSWFVDFDPVRAKMEGRDTGLPQPLADLFPDRLVESELGEIPEGWEIKPLEKAAMTACPPNDVLGKLDSMMSPLVERIIQNSLQSRTLAALRDTLLPKLISGELRVANAEHIAKAES